MNEPNSGDEQMAEGVSVPGATQASIDELAKQLAAFQATVMTLLGPQGPQAMEMGELRKEIKKNEQANDTRFKALEQAVFQNKLSGGSEGESNKRRCLDLTGGEEGGERPWGGFGFWGSPWELD